MLKSALLGRCPLCGRGHVFAGVMDIRPASGECGLDFTAHDAGDGPAMAGIFLIGAIAVGLALWVDRRFEPDLWVHALIWPVLVLPLSLLVMRFAKAMLLGLQWRHRSTS
ncbi:MAG: DUF983 domain-containing protein [Alphaproteobacteria bacterium]